MQLKTRMRFLWNYFQRSIPILIILSAALLALLMNNSWIDFAYKIAIVICVSTGLLYSREAPKAKRDTVRKACNLVVGIIFVFYAGIFLKTSLQIEEFVFGLHYFITGKEIKDIIYFIFIMKVFAPLLIGRGCCGWGCWTSAVLDLLPVKSNRPIPKAWTLLRYPVLLLSFLVPSLFILFHLDSGPLRFGTKEGAERVLNWFIVSNALYYVVGIALAFIIGKRRAFCKIFCPVGLLMSFTARFALLKLKPSGRQCVSCGKCSLVCPMDVAPMKYIENKKPVATAECIHCYACRIACPTGAIN